MHYGNVIQMYDFNKTYNLATFERNIDYIQNMR